MLLFLPSSLSSDWHNYVQQLHTTHVFIRTSYTIDTYIAVNHTHHLKQPTYQPLYYIHYFPFLHNDFRYWTLDNVYHKHLVKQTCTIYPLNWAHMRNNFVSCGDKLLLFIVENEIWEKNIKHSLSLTHSFSHNQVCLNSCIMYFRYDWPVLNVLLCVDRGSCLPVTNYSRTHWMIKKQNYVWFRDEKKLFLFFDASATFILLSVQKSFDILRQQIIQTKMN